MARNSHLENNVFKAFRPVFTAQFLVGNARVNVVDNLAVPRFWYQKVYSCISLIICCGAVVYLINNSTLYKIDSHWFIRGVLCYGVVVSSLLVNGFTIINNNFFNVAANCNLMTKLQQIDQTLKITKNERHYRLLYRLNCFLVVFAIIFHTFGSTLIIVESLGFSGLYIAVPAIVTFTAHDLEIVLFVGIVMFLISRVRYINAMMDRSVEGKWNTLAHFKSSMFVRNLFYTYRKILIVYDLTEKTFGHYLFLLILHMFGSQMLALERFILQGKVMSWTLVYQNLTVVLKVYNRILVAGLFVSSLEGQFTATKICCLRFITHTKSKESRRQAKNILRLLSLVRPMTIFRVFTITSLPIQLAAVTATYSVVLLQFAF